MLTTRVSSVPVLQPAGFASNSSSSAGPIAGGVVGGLLGLLAIVLIALFLRKRRAKARASQFDEDMFSPHHHPGEYTPGVRGSRIEDDHLGGTHEGSEEGMMTQVFTPGQNLAYPRGPESTFTNNANLNPNFDMAYGGVNTNRYSVHSQGGASGSGHSHDTSQHYGSMALSTHPSLNRPDGRQIQYSYDPSRQVRSPASILEAQPLPYDIQERLAHSDSSHSNNSETAATTGSSSHYHPGSRSPPALVLASLPESSTPSPTSLAARSLSSAATTPTSLESTQYMLKPLVPPPFARPELVSRTSLVEPSQFLGARVVN